MLNLAVRNTNKIIREKSKKDNVRLGRMFTKKDTARLMAELCEVPHKESVYVLDAGAGTGILSAAIVEKLCSEQDSGIKQIYLTAYETDKELIPMLKDNLERIRKKVRHDYKIKLVNNIVEDNFLVACADAYRDTLFTGAMQKYDVIVTNPPEELVSKDSNEASVYEDVCAKDTEKSALFTALASVMLNENGQICALLPTKTAYSSYLSKFRRTLLSRVYIERLHIFAKKAKVKGAADPTKKDMIFKLRLGDAKEKITVSSSYDDGSLENLIVLPEFDYNFIVRGEDKNILLVKNNEELEILRFVESQPETLASLGLKMKTGLTLESRYPELLSDKLTDSVLPLISPNCIKNGRVNFPVPNRKNQFIMPRIPSLMQKNKNMLFIKRVPAKADGRRFICGIYLASQFPKFKYISTHNKLNYLDYEGDKEMNAAMIYGVYAVLSSMLYERYCAILSLSTQINSKDYVNLPMPSEEILCAIGAKLGFVHDLSLKNCDAIVNSALRSTKNDMMRKI
ncbi:MAG: N-6 DNA methylase [Clostridia bacterium]|nr:N-6 DNA methylase [Clostridia bacterium]